MIEDSKFVQSIISNSPKKGWKITWHDEKKDNIFNEAWLKILDQAQKEQRMVHFTKEKNEAGYWNILTLELASLEAEAVSPKVEESAMPKEKLPLIKYIDSETAKIRSICVAYAKDAWIADKIEYKQIYSCADMFLKYIRNEEVK